jgi:hypothetical protein
MMPRSQRNPTFLGRAITPPERALLLVIARVLRAKIASEIYDAEQDDDYFALCEALKPFDPIDEQAAGKAMQASLGKVTKAMDKMGESFQPSKGSPESPSLDFHGTESH